MEWDLDFASEAQGQKQESKFGICQKSNQMTNAKDDSCPWKYMASKSQRNGLELKVGNKRKWDILILVKNNSDNNNA